MAPSEFYELSMDDYRFAQAGFRNRMQIVESWHRRSAHIIAASQIGSEKADPFIESAWPYGDQKIKDNIAEMIKRKRERGHELKIKHNDNLQFQEIVKQLKQNGGRVINTNRR